MLMKQHESAFHRIGFEPSNSSPARIQQGVKYGYFDDTATKALLGLDDDDTPLNAGTYGRKELGQDPIEMSVLRDGSYDQHLMPFVPRHHTYYSNQLTLHNHNGQWLPLVASITALWNVFSEILDDVLKLAECTGLSLLSYALGLVPRLCYNISPDSTPFFFQLLPFFTPTALRVQWCRIGRVIALLEGCINLCTRLLYPDPTWARGEPVGIRVDSTSYDGNVELIKAYRFLSILFTSPLELASDVGYSLENA